MRSFGLFVPLAVIAAVGWMVVRTTGSHRVDRSAAATRRGGPLPSGEPRANGSSRATSRLADDLARWVALGLLSDDQALGILTHETAIAPQGPPPSEVMPPTRPGRIPAVAEALGYLGGMLAGIGLVLIVARYWPDIATAAKLALSGAGALALVGAGALVHAEADPALQRLRGFLWLVSTGATAVFTVVLTGDGLDIQRSETVALACSGAVALQSGLLWWWRERPLQQLTFLAAFAVMANTAVAELAGTAVSGITVWGLGAAYLFLGVRHRTPLSVLTLGAGAVAVIVGAGIVTSDWQGFGLLFAVGTALGLTAIAAVPTVTPDRSDQLVAGILGGIALVQTTPAALVYFARDAGVATGLATWALGAALLFTGARQLVRLPAVAELLGGAAVIGGAAITGVQWHGFAPVFGVVTAVALIALGVLPGQVLLSVLGSLGLLVNVPWTIGWFSPGEGRVPLLIMVSGALILAVAVVLTRMRDRFRRDLAGPGYPPAPPRAAPGHPQGRPPPLVS